MSLPTVFLPGTDMPTTRLGFGCSNLLGDKTREEGLALLEAAYEAGIRHFDVARAYGYGDAEGVVGRFAHGKRDTLTLTTKFGLQPMAQGAGAKGAVDLVRGLMRRFSFIRNLVRRQAKNMVQKNRFDVPTAQAALETSLRELQTDVIDLYLLHEAEAGDMTPELLDFLQNARQSGKIRAFGVGTGFVRVPEILEKASDFAGVLQFESSVTVPNVAKLPPERRRNILTHGAFAGYSDARDRLAADADFASRYTSALNIEPADTRALLTLVMRSALQENKDGIVLFRSTDKGRIAQTVAATQDEQFTPAQVAAFRALCDGWGK